MWDSISSTCTCGAEFGVKSNKAERLWKEWKDSHACPNGSDHHTTLSADTEVIDNEESEFSIGFQYEPDE